ncbi:MAG: ABC transporter ATP-binding protein [Bacteroidia bacterium]|nr:ABC transporter ATP-binding protein [Bacteroidia bacterium]
MGTEANIRLNGAALGYSNRKSQVLILENLNLEFFAGEFIAVVGLNGTGKSTLLKSMCGLLPLLEGDVFLDGQNLKSLELNQVASKIAVVLTEKIGGFNLNAFDAVAAGQMPYTNAFHQLKENHLEIINTAIETVGLKEHVHKPIQELSDGLFQKTMIAKALAQQTPTILLDEPSAFLDYASKHELFILLKNLALNENKCILVSSHDLDLVVKYCSKVMVVADKGAAMINASEALKNEAFQKIAGGFI